MQELDQRGINSVQTLAKFNIHANEVSHDDRFVPAATMYAIVEELAAISGDPWFGVRVGEKLNPWSWSPLIEAAGASNSVGDFLLRFMQSAIRDESSVTYILKTIDNHSSFHECRFSDGGVYPRHNDGFTIAYLLAIIHGAVSDSWDGSRVMVRLCDPAVVPTGYMGVRLAQTDTLGPSITFPAEWLIKPFKLERMATKHQPLVVGVAPEPSMISAFRQALQPYIQEFDLNVRRVAEICGLSSRTLARRMHAKGTSVGQELIAMRRQKAEQLLQNTDHKIANIANEVGYADLAVFSRAFKRWTGKSPNLYRKQFVNQKEAHPEAKNDGHPL